MSSFLPLVGGVAKNSLKRRGVYSSFLLLADAVANNWCSRRARQPDRIRESGCTIMDVRSDLQYVDICKGEMHDKNSLCYMLPANAWSLPGQECFPSYL